MATIVSDRTAIYSGVIVQSAVMAISFSYSGIWFASYHYDLDLWQYGLLFIPQLLAAFLAARFSTALGTRLRAQRAYLGGLSCSLMAMILLVATEWAKRTAFTYPLLLAAMAFVGAGFGLSFPCVRCYAVSLKPLRARRQILLVNGLVAAGLAASPVYAFATRTTSIWWSLPVVLGVLLIAGMLRGRSLCEPLDGPPVQRADRRVEARFRFYPWLALLYGLCVIALITAPHYLTGPVPSARHLPSLVLVEAAFWGALVQGSRVVFAIIDGLKSRRYAASMGVFTIALVILALSIAIARYDLMHVGLYLLGAIGCAALLPIDTRPGKEHIAALPLAVTAALLALFPAGLGLSRLGYDIVIRTGMSPLDLFLGVALVGAASCILLLPAILNWRTMAYFDLPATRYAPPPAPPSVGHPGAAALPGPPAPPQPRRSSDRPDEGDRGGWKPGSATALPQSPQRDSRREGR